MRFCFMATHFPAVKDKTHVVSMVLLIGHMFT